MRYIIAPLLIFVFVILCSRGCTDGPGAKRTLENSGFSNVEITGHRWFGGGEGDVWRTGFSATGPNGRRVTGVVTSGFMKGNTIRLD